MAKSIDSLYGPKSPDTDNKELPSRPRTPNKKISTISEMSFAELFAVKVFVSMYIILLIEGRDTRLLDEAFEATSLPEIQACVVALDPGDLSMGTLSRAIITSQGNTLGKFQENEAPCIHSMCTALFDHAYLNRGSITAIHIVGFSSPEWPGQYGDSCFSKTDCNMKLATERAANIHRVCRTQIGDDPAKLKWFDSHVLPVGGGTSSDQGEISARRVEFRYYFDSKIFTDATEKSDLQQ